MFTLFMVLADGTERFYVGPMQDVLSMLQRTNYAEHTIVHECGHIPVWMQLPDGDEVLACLHCEPEVDHDNIA